VNLVFHRNLFCIFRSFILFRVIFEVLHIFWEFLLIKRKKKIEPALGRDSGPRPHWREAATRSLADPRLKRFGLLGPAQG
jgi:hypothetical protein